MPKPVRIALGVVAALVSLQVVWPPLLFALIGDGSELGMLFRLGLLVAVIAGLRWFARKWKDPAFRDALLTAGVATARTIPPLARTIAGGARQLFDALRSCIIYLCGVRWPKALIWFWLTLGIIFLQSIPWVGIILLLLLAPLWSIVTINVGFAMLVFEPLRRNISPAWSLVGLSWFVGYAAVTVHGHLALDRLSAEIATENSRPPLPFDPRTQSLVVVGQRYEAPNAERLLTTYRLPVVYEENEDAGAATSPSRARDGRPRFTALRLGAPDLCDSITDNGRLKATVTRHGRTIVNGMPACLYAAIEAPDLPVIRIRSAQEKLRIVGAEGQIERTTLASGSDKREVASVRAAPYLYLPLPLIGCFFSGRGSGWGCSFEFWKETQRPYPDNVALVGRSLGLEPASPASRSEQIHAAGPAPLERARDLDEAAAAAELDRLLAQPIGSTAQLNLNVLSARPDLLASRAERLAAAAAEALTTRDNWRDNQTWSALMAALPDADFRRVGPDFVAAVIARWTVDARRSSSVHLGERLIYRLADLGPAALPLLERVYQYNASFDRLASVVTLCRLGAPAFDLTNKIRARVFDDEHDPHAQEMREAMILALLRQGRSDVADAARRQYEQSTAAERGNRGGDISVWSKDFEEKSRTMTPSSPADACMIARR